jgi:hypothetical protein
MLYTNQPLHSLRTQITSIISHAELCIWRFWVQNLIDFPKSCMHSLNYLMPCQPIHLKDVRKHKLIGQPVTSAER